MAHAGQKEASTRSHHEERAFEASQVRGLLMAWIGGTPQLPHKRSVQSDSRLDTLRRASNSTSHRNLRTSLCGRRAGLWASQRPHGVVRWWDRRLIHEPTASADAVLVKRSPMVAKTALVYRVERSPRGCIGTSGRVCAGGGREFGHPRAHTVSCGGGTVARSMSRPPQLTLWS